MKIHLLSDVHLEFEDFTPAVTDADVTILAGDIAPKLAGVRWALERFPGRVLYVPGNHEYYGTKMDTNFEQMRELAQAESSDRVQVLNREAVVIDNVRFLCGTAWTDFNLYGSAPLKAMQAQGVMSDYRHIRIAKEGYRKLKPADTMHEAHRFRSWLQGQMAQPFEGKTVVVTHHAPSAKSLFYSDTITNPCYASRWDDLTEGAALWVHGHTHKANDYQIGDCRMVINPKGYPGQDTGFDPELLIEL